MVFSPLQKYVPEKSLSSTFKCILGVTRMYPNPANLILDLVHGDGTRMSEGIGLMIFNVGDFGDELRAQFPESKPHDR